MKPSKQESVSRQSSILKVPKQRQPLQCVATNPSSSENSPTVKIKRRVSFAKNRRIRQFCNEAEQETVWDNTYEEHDSSHTKSSSSGSPEKPIIISVPSHDKENFPVQLFLKSNQLDCKEVSTNAPVEDGDNLSQCDMEMDNSLINTEVGNALPQSNESEYPNATIYYDDGMDMTSYEPANIIPSRAVSASLEDTALISQSRIQDISMELTENIPCILSKNFNQVQQNVLSTDLTQALSKLLGPGKHVDRELLADGCDSTNTVPIEFSSILPSSTWIKQNTPNSNNENAEHFSNKTVEFTAAVLCPDIKSNINNQKLNNKTRLSERTEMFSNKSMEITEAVPVLNKDRLNHSKLKLDNQNLIQENTEIFCNKAMEMTEAICNYNKKFIPAEKTRILNTSMEMTEIPILNKIHQMNTENFSNQTMEFTAAVSHSDFQSNAKNEKLNSKTRLSERTEMFSNKSMEITEAVPVLNKDRLNTSKLKLDNQNLIQENTEIFCNKSMEMTEAICNYNKKFIPAEKTKILNTSMEMTEIPILNKIHQMNVENFSNQTMEFTAAVTHSDFQSNAKDEKLNSKTRLSQKTEMCSNKSMEITEAVPVLNKDRLNTSKLKLDNQNVGHEKTEIFHNKSMEMTEAISNYNKNLYPAEKTRILNTSMEMTEIPILNKIHQMNTENFGNQTMEFTAAVAHSDFQSNANIEKLNSKTRLSERTEMFSNKSMEITEAVPVHNKDHLKDSNLKLLNQNVGQEKTEIFCNKSMDVTDIISNYNKLNPAEKSKILNTSMEMTEIPILNKIHQINTENFGNQTMEFTAAVPCANNQNLNNKIEPSERPDNFLNKSMEMEMTEAVPVLNRNCLSNTKVMVDKQNLVQETTEIFCNKSMEMTEAISNYNKKLVPEEETKFLDASMEMTGIPIRNKIQRINTENFSNETMEFTSAVRCTDIQSYRYNPVMSNKSVPLERTNIFSNKSMEITEAVSVLNKDYLNDSNIKLVNQNVGQEKTEIFCNKSMEMTEAISNCNKKNYPSDKTRISSTSMEMTDIPILNKIHQINTESSNKTMEFTLAVPYTDFQRITNNQNLTNKTRLSERTEMFLNKSMEITEAVPVLNKDHLSNDNLKLDNQNLIQEKTEIFYNKSVDITEALPNNNKKLYPEEKTRILNASMEMTEIPMINNIHQINSAQEKTNIFPSKQITQDKANVYLDKSKDITETVPINQHFLKTKLINQYNSKTTKENKSSIEKADDLTDAIIAGIDNFISNEKVNETALDTSKNSKSNTSHGNGINSRLSVHKNAEASSKSIENISVFTKDCNLQSKNLEEKNYLLSNNAARINQDISMDMTSRLAILQNVTKEFPSQAKSNGDKYCQSGLGESNKEYQDISMDFTEPDILTFSKSNSKQLQSSNIQRNLSSRTNKEENKFQRLTTDELQILCASLNLPTQKSEKEESVISENMQNFITDCNDVNVLRDSLKNKSNFQKSNILSDGGKSFNIAAEVNNDLRINYDLDTKKKNLETIMDFSALDKSVTTTKTNLLKTMIIPASMEIDKTIEINLKCSELPEISFSSTKVMSASTSENKNNEFAKTPLIFNREVPETVEITMTEAVVNSAVQSTVEMSKRNSEVQLYNDISMEYSSNQSISASVKRKSSEKNQSPLSKKNFISLADRSVFTSESATRCKENSDIPSKENSLSRMPSDSTDVLVATMGFKTELPHPLIINEKTMIKVSTKSFSNKTYSIGGSSSIHSEIQADKTYVVNKMENQIDCMKVDQKQQEDENVKQLYEIPIVESNVEDNEEQDSNSDKENREPRVRQSLFPEHFSEELEEIQPPSFLDSDSFQNESLDKREMQDYLSDSVFNNSHKQQSNSYLHKEENEISDTNKKQNSSPVVIRKLFNVDSNPPEQTMPKNKKYSKKNKVKKIEDFEEIPSQEEINKGVNQETVVSLTPFELLTENIKAHEKRDDCIWSIRSINSNMITADFISKSLVFVIRLNALDVACNKDIENVQIISRLRPGSKNVLLKIVHNLLLAKLKPEELLEKYKMYEDVLPMLDYVSSEVIFAMNFKFDVERLNATNVFDIDEKRILFMVASKKTNIILKVSLLIKVFNDIRADDVHVTCILGDIRKNDIKQLIVNIKKDSKFLSRYISDVRDYITLMEESTCLNKH